LFQANLRRELYKTMGAGFALNAWSDDQVSGLSRRLAETPALDVMRQALEAERANVSKLLSQVDPNSPKLIRFDWSGDTMFPSAGMAPVLEAFSTSQQVHDNVAFLHHTIDRSLNRFDPESGIAHVAATGDAELSSEPGSSLSWFERYYYMYALPYAKDYLNLPSDTVIRAQSDYDHAQLAIALELHQRKTGQYPDSLEEVGTQFQNGLPVDIATGERYGYQRLPEGGYRLWGHGVARKDEGAKAPKEIIWVHQPLKAD
jgi:hypothetical protein